MSDIIVKQLPPMDGEILEEWIRETQEEDILGVGAARSDDEWPWQVTIYVAEFVRKEPLESKLHQSILSAIKTVPGVTDVEHEDREIWIAKGNPKGEDLVRACAKVVDSLSESTRKAIEEF